MAGVRSKRGYTASLFSDAFLVHQHRRKRNAEGTGDQGKTHGICCVMCTFCFFMNQNSVPTFGMELAQDHVRWQAF